MIFLRIAWMDRYDGLASGDAIRGGGAFVAQHGYGHEIFNFRPWNGQVYGYVRPPGAAHNDESNRTIDISRLGAGQNDKSVSGVLVVWVATRPQSGGVIVGWYKNATVFRDWQKPPAGAPRSHAGSDFGYFVTAEAENATLLPKDARLLLVPRGKGGMGQSNIWYADGGGGHQNFRQTVQTFVTTRRLPAPTTPDGPARQADPYLRQRVERAAVDVTVAYYMVLGYEVSSVEKDNRGWDLEAVHPNLSASLKLEVKGLSGPETCVEVTPNEYAQMREYRDSYRLCVVTTALTGPELAVFAYSEKSDAWEDEKGRVLRIEEITAAQCRADSSP